MPPRAPEPVAAAAASATDRAAFVARVLLLVVLVVLTAQFAFARTPDVVAGSFLHMVDLVFHEAGHVLFAPFGRFLTMLGGSLFQVIVPVVCAAALWKHADRFGAAVCVWWTGQNLVDLAPYIGDARALALPLIGGATGAEVEGHDWEAILQTLGWMHHDRLLATFAHGAGSLIMMAALGAAAWFTLRPSGAHADAAHGQRAS